MSESQNQDISELQMNGSKLDSNLVRICGCLKSTGIKCSLTMNSNKQIALFDRFMACLKIQYADSSFPSYVKKQKSMTFCEGGALLSSMINFYKMIWIRRQFPGKQKGVGGALITKNVVSNIFPVGESGHISKMAKGAWEWLTSSVGGSGGENQQIGW